MKTTVRIATRKSPLALWQANHVKNLLLEIHPELEVEVLGLLTTADKMLATPLNKIGGKGLFVKELEKAIQEHQADIAVHSIKDMPAILPENLELAAVMKRDDSRDVLVSNHQQTFKDLPSGAVIGTSSLRRRAQLLAIRPDLRIKPLRGNLGTRIQKLEDNEFDAIILAAAGLKRLGLTDKITYYFSLAEMIPAAGQGAIGIECRSHDNQTKDLIAPLNDPETTALVIAERAFNAKLGGSCQFPIAGHAFIADKSLYFMGLVSNTSGTTLLRVNHLGTIKQAKEIGLQAANKLIEQGAEQLLQQALSENPWHDQ